MAMEFAKLIVSKAKEIKTDTDSLLLPPSEVLPSREQPVLPMALFKRCNRTYIVKVAHQINRTYIDTCYDACSVMIRRLVETLIIEVYEAQGVDHKIKDSQGEFKSLKNLIDEIVKEKWNLTRNCKNGLNGMKTVGDLSAHSRRYNAHREDIDRIAQDLRVAVQELLTLAGMY